MYLSLVARDDGLGHPLDGDEALLEIADEPARLLQLLCKQRAVAVPRAAELRRILLVDPKLRIHCGIDHADPALALLADDYIRNDGARLERAHARSGARVEAADEIPCDTNLGLGAEQRFLQAREVARREQGEPVVRQLEREPPARRLGGHRKQLQPQVLFSELHLPDGDGVELGQELDESIPTVLCVLAGKASFEGAVAALRLGASDYLVKPFDPERVRALLRRSATLPRERSAAGRGAPDDLRGLVRFGRMRGNAPAMQALSPTSSTEALVGATRCSRS
jgi:CheY-like chemotaxis protein